MVPDSTAESLEDEPAKKAKNLSDDNATNHVAHQRWRRQAVAGSRRNKPQRGAGRNAKNRYLDDRRGLGLARGVFNQIPLADVKKVSGC